MSALAARYANAFVDAVLARPDVKPESVLEQLRAVQEAYCASRELRILLSSPAVPAQQKRSIVARLGELLEFPRLVQNLILVLIHNRRTELLGGTLVQAVEEALDERMGRVRAEVSSALELLPEQKQRLEDELSRVAGKRVRCEYLVDPALVGGVLARIGSRVYDGSIRGRLQYLRERLI